MPCYVIVVDFITPYILLNCHTAECPEGMMSLGKTCYVTVEESQTAADSRIMCQTQYLGGDLASVNSDDALQLLADDARNANIFGACWIGLMDNKYEGGYTVCYGHFTFILSVSFILCTSSSLCYLSYQSLYVVFISC